MTKFTKKGKAVIISTLAFAAIGFADVVSTVSHYVVDKVEQPDYSYVEGKVCQYRCDYKSVDEAIKSANKGKISRYDYHDIIDEFEYKNHVHNSSALKAGSYKIPVLKD